MEDILEMVIKIPKEIYEIAKQDKWKWPADDVYNAIKIGVVLPKGHGKLIDADELKKNAYSASAFTQVVDVSDIDNVHTILEGTK